MMEPLLQPFSSSRVSAFASRLSPLSERQRQAYSYLFDESKTANVAASATKRSPSSVSVSSKLVTSDGDGDSVDLELDSKIGGEVEWSMKPARFNDSMLRSKSSRKSASERRRNSVIGAMSYGSSNNANGVCKELVDLDLHTSFENFTIGDVSGKIGEQGRERLETSGSLNGVPRPGNPLATLFNRQSNTPEPVFS